MFLACERLSRVGKGGGGMGGMRVCGGESRADELWDRGREGRLVRPG